MWQLLEWLAAVNPLTSITQEKQNYPQPRHTNTATLFLIASSWKPTTCQLPGGWVNRVWCMYCKDATWLLKEWASHPWSIWWLSTRWRQGTKPSPESHTVGSGLKLVDLPLLVEIHLWGKKASCALSGLMSSEVNGNNFGFVNWREAIGLSSLSVKAISFKPH